MNTTRYWAVFWWVLDTSPWLWTPETLPTDCTYITQSTCQHLNVILKSIHPPLVHCPLMFQTPNMHSCLTWKQSSIKSTVTSNKYVVVYNITSWEYVTLTVHNDPPVSASLLALQFANMVSKFRSQSCTTFTQDARGDTFPKSKCQVMNEKSKEGYL